jgi:predicted nucleotidyltransferase
VNIIGITKYPNVNNVLDSLLKSMQNILSIELIGAYLYGSLIAGDFDENISDIDLLVVIQDQLSNDELDKLKSMHNEIAANFPIWNDRIETAYITKNALQTFRDQSSIIAIISPGEPFHTKEAGLDWIINGYLIQEQSKTLIGPPASTLISNITKEEYISAVRKQLREWNEWIESSHTRGFQAYAILTICRGLYSIHFGQQATKKEAAHWVAQNYPAWAELIQNAILWREQQWETGQIEDEKTYVETVRFVRFGIDENNHALARIDP